MASIQQLLASYAVAAAAAFPTLLDITNTDTTSPFISHNISMPAVVSAGDLLIAIVTTTASVTITAPSGWVSIYATMTSPISIGIFYKVAAGTEGGTTVLLSTTGSAQLSGQVYRIAALTYSGVPEAARVSGVSTSAPDSPSLSPSWGALDTLWVAGFAMNATSTVTSYPYPSSQASSGSTAPVLVCCSANVSASSLDPAPFSISATAQAAAYTLAIRPA